MITPSPDLTRILALPERDPPQPDPLELPMPEAGRTCHCAALGRKCPTQFFGVQRASLEEMASSRGAFLMISVGGGKTAILLLASIVMGLSPAVMLMPPGQVEQTVAEARWIGGHLRIPRIYIVRSGASDPERAFADGDEPAGTDPDAILYLLPYSALSRPEATDLLHRLRIRLIVADEAHKLRHRNSATSKRVFHYLADDMDVEFVCASGTFTSRSLMDFFHLAAFALREGSPLPLDVAVAASWAECFDAGQPADLLVGAFAKYLLPGEDPREGLNRRMFRTRGVVASFECAAELLPPLRFEFLHLEVSEEIKKAIVKLKATWATPGGEELTTAPEIWAATTELLTGFYYRWVWKPGTTPEAAREWHEARCAWHRELRGRLSHRSRVGLDSPALIETAIATGRIPSSEAYERWRVAREAVAAPDTVPVWLDATWLDDVVAEARRRRALVWFTHDAVGRALGDRMPVFNESKGLVAELKKRPEPAALSMAACSEMIDGLQYLYDQQILCCPTSSNQRLEQLLGRLHRRGQEREVVTVAYDRDQEYLAEAIGRARYVKATMGLPQKLLIAQGLEALRGREMSMAEAVAGARATPHRQDVVT